MQLALALAAAFMLVRLLRSPDPSLIPDVAADEGTGPVRRPIVFVYDWPRRCFELGICREPTLEAARSIRCEELKRSTWRVSHRRDEAACASNQGYGELLGPSPFEYSTPQFSAGSLFAHRLRNSAWRTNNISEAQLFFVDFDIMLDIPCQGCASLLAKNDWLHSHVLKSLSFKRFNGLDHFMVHSYMRIDGVDSAVFDGPLHHVTKLTIENWCYLPHEYDLLRRSHHVSSLTKLPSRWAAVPYPSFFHPIQSLSNSEWPESFQPFKKFLLFVGVSVQIGKNDSEPNKVRKALLSLCETNSDICQSQKLVRIPNSTEMSFDMYASIYKKMRDSYYVVVPGGDTPTSKRFFDAIASGAIPLVLDVSIWRCIYTLEPFAGFIDSLLETSKRISFVRKNLTRLFTWARQDKGDEYRRQLPVLKKMAYSMQYAKEEDPKRFDLVDQVVSRLESVAGNQSAIFATPTPLVS